MKLSVIIPAYNCEKYLENCLQSIYSQSFLDYQIILIDDGSTDGTGAICDRAAKEHGNVLALHKENGGVSSARNMGIESAAGEHLLFIDSDDCLLDEDYFAVMMQEADYDLVAGGYTRRSEQADGTFKDQKCFLRTCEGEEVCVLPDAFFTSGFFHACWGKLYRTSIIRDNQLLFPKCRVSEDSLFNLNYMTFVRKWKITEQTGYGYYCRGTGENAIARFEDADIDVYVALHEQMKKLPLARRTVNKTMYAQYLGSCLRVSRSKRFSPKEKKEKLRLILSKPGVTRTLLFTCNNPREWVVGIKHLFMIFG